MTRFPRLADLKSQIGQPLASSDWIAIDQARIDAFAAATDDHQWIHTDPPRAAQGPFGGTIAHGFLTLSLMPAFVGSAFCVSDTGLVVNYGLDRVRFPAPVPAGSRLRAHFRLLAWEALASGAQLKLELTVEREGSPKPVCVAESLVRFFLS